MVEYEIEDTTTVQVSVRMPRQWMEALDAIAKRESERQGKEFGRADVVRSMIRSALAEEKIAKRPRKQ